jgi:succinate-acetate transporter protein
MKPANPTPAGLAGLAVACFLFFAMLSGKVGTDALPLIGAWLMGGFVIQLITAWFDLKAGNEAGGNTFVFFACMFMLAGALEMFLKYNAAKNGTPLDVTADGYAWLVNTLVLWVWTPAFCKKFSLLSVIVLLVDLALPWLALADLGVLPKGVTLISAYSLLAAGVVAIYLLGAMITNGAYGKAVFPLPGVKYEQKDTKAAKEAA